MKPLPWSPSSLDTFKNCPEQYHHKYVLKDLPFEPQSEEQRFGEYAHKKFELRQNDPDGEPLPSDLVQHEPFMQRLDARPGTHFTELKIGFDRKARPISWEHRNLIWFRGVIDWCKVDHESRRGSIVDYKTGKPHEKFGQLGMYAIWLFTMYDWLEAINAQFYWTKTQTTTRKIWTREDVDLIWADVLDDLKQYAEAFQLDVWQERPSGLCRGWCPVKSCKHWKPRKEY